MNPTRPCCALLLALAGAPASASWSYVGDIAEGVVYYDDATPKKSAALATVMVMINYTQEDPPKAPPKAAGKPPASAVFLVEMDCAEPRLRELNAEGYTQQNGKGTPLQKSAVPGAWKRITAQFFPKPEGWLKIHGFACAAAKP